MLFSELEIGEIFTDDAIVKVKRSDTMAWVMCTDEIEVYCPESEIIKIED